ncbi:MAG: hypothetical protein QCI82_05115 [Candidatus Thermoplasmatota archaeon]|nr:hypothetical protein [Candidatus Thermoplasmatota archaeon]
MTVEGSIGRRKAAGIASMVVGVPNFVSAVLLCFSGVVLAIILIVVAIAMISEDRGANPLKDACALFILIMILIFLVVSIVATLIALVFALAVGGQTLGGWYAYKGRRYTRSLVLTFLGCAAALVMGSAIALIAVFGKGIHLVPRMLLALVALYEFLSFMVSFSAGIVIARAKETFDRDPIKKKGRSPE